MSNCPHCNTQVEQNNKFCGSCGTKLESPPKQEAPSKPSQKTFLSGKYVAETVMDKFSKPRTEASPETPMSWYRFYTYFIIPLQLLIGLIMFFAGVWIEIIVIGLLFFLLYGLHKRRLWAWKLNMVTLVVVVIANSYMASFQHEHVWPLFVTLTSVVLAAWFFPNLIYFQKRRHLFR